MEGVLDMEFVKLVNVYARTAGTVSTALLKLLLLKTQENQGFALQIVQDMADVLDPDASVIQDGVANYVIKVRLVVYSLIQ